MSAGIAVRPQQYYNAAAERLEEVRLLRSSGQRDSGLAAYLSGLSVECMLRAFIPSAFEFYPKHDFYYLGAQSDVLPFRAVLFGRLNGSLNDLAALWQNRIRFFDEQRFQAHCRERVHSLRLPVPGNTTPSAVVCRRLYDACEQVNQECQEIWKRLPSPVK